MAETKITTMEIKVVDLGCEKCHKKIKKVLCAIPQIQNQIYDKKANKVTITVVCCCPEKIKKEIYCKGGKAVKCIEIPPPTPPPSPPRCQCPPPPTPPCTCCGKCRRGPCCFHFCMLTVPPYCYVPCRMSVCDVWGDGCCSCRRVTMCAEVHMFVKSTIPRRHAQSCKGKSSSEDRWFESTSSINRWIQIQWS
ncbi:PREDICTED: sperm mitochondrial-associated cysteine-rich protein-like [Populus euphratica]|uniref:Sperm mitochondrial-associated cysteine-rich protein-like n=1 Tax=Populus euphratica TaxID=75702 RepID=A0AAJ6T4H0_POPEU|nr:PREDICTED: sperm mitochondrial-associated cysteine-rich protein-like [Populus euphratica]